MAKKTFILSDESIVNSYGFRVMTGGIILDRFKSNPVMLFNHSRWGAEYDGPIGNWSNITIKNGQLMGDAEFDLDDPKAKRVGGKVDRGFLRGASIGIIDVIEWSEDPALMLPGQKYPTVTKCIISEASVVDIPANELSVALLGKDGQPIAVDDEEGIRAFLSAGSSTKPVNIFKNKMTEIKLFAALLSLPEEATAQDVTAAINKLNNDLTAANAKLGQLETQLKAEKDSKIKAYIDQLEKDGKTKPEQREQLTKLAVADFDSFLALTSSMTAPVLPITLAIGEKRNAADAIADRKDWKLSDWHKNDYPGLMKLKQEDPTTYYKLVNNK